MTTPTRPPHRDPERSGVGAGFAGIGAVILMIACCAAPFLIAAGALAGIGAWLSNPWVITAAAVLVIAAVATVVRRRRSGGDACCPPGNSSDSNQTPADRDRPYIPDDQKGPRSR